MKSLTKKETNAIKKIAVHHGATVVYLFGSHANGTATKESDVDIAILLPEKLSTSERFDIRCLLSEKISALLDRPVDLVVLNDVSSILFRFTIIKEGKVLYQKTDLIHVEYELKIMSEYYDFEPFLTSYNRAYVARAV